MVDAVDPLAEQLSAFGLELPSSRARWRLQLNVVPLAQRKLNVGMALYKSTSEDSLESDMLCHFCPYDTPDGYPHGCRKPIPDYAHSGGLFVCPSCGLTGPEEMLSEQVYLLNMHIDSAAKYIYQAFVNCNHDADLYLVRAKVSQAQMREASKAGKISEMESRRLRRLAGTERCKYLYKSLIRDTQNGSVLKQIVRFLSA